MPTVNSLSVHVIAARTDNAGAGISPDWDQEELRLPVTALMRAGLVAVSLKDHTANPNAFRVRQDSGSNMFVQVGSGVSGADGCVLLGAQAGQGAYLVRLDSTGLDVAVPAADGSLPRKYGVYAHINDALYAGTASRDYADITVLAGTPNASPTVPAPTAAWSASWLLWSFQLAAAATAVTNAILDNANAADGRTTSTVIGVNPIELAVFS